MEEEGDALNTKFHLQIVLSSHVILTANIYSTKFQLTESELRVLRECRTNSLYLRGMLDAIVFSLKFSTHSPFFIVGTWLICEVAILIQSTISSSNEGIVPSFPPNSQR